MSALGYPLLLLLRLWRACAQGGRQPITSIRLCALLDVAQAGRERTCRRCSHPHLICTHVFAPWGSWHRLSSRCLWLLGVASGHEMPDLSALGLCFFWPGLFVWVPPDFLLPFFSLALHAVAFFAAVGRGSVMGACCWTFGQIQTY